jgi:hypothetical protein
MSFLNFPIVQTFLWIFKIKNSRFLTQKASTCMVALRGNFSLFDSPQLIPYRGQKNKVTLGGEEGEKKSYFRFVFIKLFIFLWHSLGVASAAFTRRLKQKA